MFLGEYNYKLDAKGRAPIPPKFRDDFKDGVVLSIGAEKCIVVYTPTQWKEISENIASGALASFKMRKFNRGLFAGAFSLNLDRQGRVVLPAPLRQHAGISDDIVVAGANNYLEIWNKADWEQEKLDSQSQIWQIIETLDKR